MSDKTPEQLNYSRPFDVHKWSTYPEVNRFVDSVWEEFLASEFIESTSRGKRPKASLKKQFKASLLDLYVAWLEDPELLIGISLTKASFKPNSRYNALHLSYSLVKVVHYLHEIGLIGLHLGSELSGRSTRIWPSDKLIDLFNNCNISPLLINPYEGKEVIILNNREPDAEGNIPRTAKAIEYEDNSEIRRMRKEVNKYNDLLRKTFIDIGSLEEPNITNQYWDNRENKWKEFKVRINHHNKFVRRVFYRGSWNLGGRLHGGFWQQLSGEDRKNIRINDFRTVELDFSGLHINIAYALEGLDPIQEDPYTVATLFNVSAEEQRSWVKSLSLMALNAKDERAAFMAFRADQPTGSVAKSLTNNEVRQLLDAFKQKHDPIAKYLCSDEGVRLMNIDGEIAAQVVNHFTEINEPILCVHDSFICREQFQEELNKVMNEVIRQQLEGYVVDIKSNKVLVDLRSRAVEGVFSVTQLKDVYLNRGKDQARCEGYEARWSEHKYWLHNYVNTFLP